MEICHEIISTTILSIPLIQARKLSVSGQRMVNRLGGLPRNHVVRITDHLDMTIVVDWDVKAQLKQTSTVIVSLKSYCM